MYIYRERVNIERDDLLGPRNKKRKYTNNINYITYIIIQYYIPTICDTVITVFLNCFGSILIFFSFSKQ